MPDLQRGLIGACQALVKSMADIQKPNYAYTLTKKTGFLDYIFSDQNFAAAKATINEMTSGSKIRRLNVIYSQRTPSTVIKSGQAAMDATVCDANTTPQEKDVVVEIDNRVASRVLNFSNQQLTELCENAESFKQRYIYGEMAAAREK